MKKKKNKKNLHDYCIPVVFINGKDENLRNRSRIMIFYTNVNHIFAVNKVTH